MGPGLRMADQSAGARGAPDPRALRHRFPANPTASVSARVIPLPGPVWLIAASMAVVLLSFANDYGFQGYSADRTKRGHGRAVAAGRQALPEVDRRVPVAHPPSLDRPRAARPWRAADLR